MERFRILIVEDEAVLAMDLEQRLERMGYQIVGLAHRAQEALLMAQNEKPDLILMDVNLGGKLDGVDVSMQLRSFWDGPIIFISAYADDVTLARVQTVGASAFLVKPLGDAHEIKVNIELALKKHEMEQQLRRAEQVLHSTLQSVRDAVLVLDFAGKVQMLNQAGEALLNMHEANAVGQDVDDIIRLSLPASPQKPIPFEQLKSTFSTRVPTEVLVAADHFSGAVEITMAQDVDPRTGSEIYIVTLRDFDERRLLDILTRSLLLNTSTQVGRSFLQELSIQLGNTLGADLVTVILIQETNVLGIAASNRSLVYEIPTSRIEWERVKMAMLDECRLLKFEDGVKLEGVAFEPKLIVNRALRNTQGQNIGLLTLMFRNSREQTETTSTLVDLFAGRAAAELERLLLEQQITNHQAGLEKTVETRTAQLLESNLRLREEVAEREAISLEARQNEIRFRQLFELNPSGILLTDPKGIVTQVNPAAEQILNRVAANMIGTHAAPSTVVRYDENLHPIPRNELPLMLALNEGSVVTERAVGIHRAELGDLAWYLMNAAPVYDRAGKIEGAIVSFTDITRQKSAEQNLRKQERLLQVLNQANEMLVTGGVLESSLPKIFMMLGNALGIESVSLARMVLPKEGLPTPELSSIAQVTSGNYPLQEPQRPNGQIFDFKILPVLAQHMRQGQVYDSSEVRPVAKEAKYIQQECGASFIAFPLQQGTRLGGFLAFQNFSGNSRYWLEGEVALLRTFANILGAYLEQAETSKQLFATQELLEAAFQTGRVYVAEFDYALDSFLYVSPGLADLFQFPPDAKLPFRGDLVRTRFDPAELRMYYRRVFETAQAGKPFFEMSMRIFPDRPDCRHLLYRVQVERQPETGSIRTLSSIYDITELKDAQDLLVRANQNLEKRVEERTTQLASINLELQQEVETRKEIELKLRQNEQKYRALFDKSLDSFLLLDTKGRIVNANPAASNLLRQSVEDLNGLSITVLMSTGSAQRWDFSSRMFRQHKDVRGDLGIQLGEETRFVEFSARQGFLPGLTMAILRDVTDKRRVETELLETNQRNTNILESITDGFVALNDQLRFTYVNKKAEDLLSSHRQQLLGQSIRQQNPDLINWPVYPMLYRTAQHGETQHLELRQGRSGRWLELDLYPFEGGVGIYFRDITARKLAESLIRDREERYRALFERSQESILIHDLEGNLMEVNPTAATLLEFHPIDLIDKDIFSLISKDNQEAYRQQIADTLSTTLRPGFQDIEFRTQSGCIVYLSVNTSVIRRESRPWAIQLMARDMTDYRLSEIALRTSEANISAILQSRREAIILYDLEQRVILFNPEQFRLTSLVLNHELAPGQFVKDIVPPAYYQNFLVYWQQSLETGSTREEIQLPVGNLGLRWFFVERSCVYTKTGELLGLAVVTTDIHEQKEAQLALAVSEERYRTSEENLSAILQSSTQAIMLYDLDKNLIVFNAEQRRLTISSLQIEMKPGMNISEILPVDYQTEFNRIWALTLEKSDFVYETEVEFQGGILRWYSVQMNTVFNNQNELIGISIVGTDIHEKKLSNLEIERSERRYRTLEQNAFDITMVLDEHLTIKYVTPSIEKINGYHPDALLGEAFLSFLHPDDEEMVHNAFQALYDPENREQTADKTVILEFRIKGLWQPYDTYEVRAINKVIDPEINGFILNAINISERLQAQRQMHMLTEAVEGASDAILITTPGLEYPEPLIVYANAAFCRMTGYRKDELSGLSPRILQGPETDYEELKTLKRELALGNKYVAETYNYRKDGTAYIVEWAISPIRNYAGKITYWLSTQRDVTERRQMEREAELAKIERQNAITSAIIYAQEEQRKRIAEDLHDGLGSILSVLSMHFSMIPDRFAIETEEQRSILDETDRMLKEATSETRNISRNLMPTTLHSFGMVSAMRKQITSVENSAISKIENLKITFRENLGNSRYPEIVEITLFRVFQELLNNAVKYSKAQQISISLKEEKEYLRMVIKDNGVGFDAKNPDIKGSGMGLQNINTRLELLGGKASVKSKLGKGTTIEIEAPISINA
jgi:PAS domain S-box-containing protein